MTRETAEGIYSEGNSIKEKKLSDMHNRENIINQSGADIFISIHMNSFPDSKYSGLQVYYSKNDPESRILAECIQNTVHKHLQPQNDRQIKPAGSNIFILDRIKIPAVLIECGFLSNDTEALLLSDPVYQKKLTVNLFLSISKYIAEST